MLSHRRLLSGADVPLAALVAATGFTAAFLGTLFGFVAGRYRRSVGGDSESEETPEGQMTWMSLADLQAKLAQKDRMIRRLEQRYRLDTGLLKQEIHRLNAFLDGLRSPHPEETRAGKIVDRPVEERTIDAPSGYHHDKVIAPSAGDIDTRDIRFEPLDTLTPESAESESGPSDGPA